MPATAIIARPNQVLPPLALTTVEDYYEITLESGASSGYLGTLQLRANADWWYSETPGGPYFPVYAREVLVLSRMANGSTVYAKTASGTGTLYVLEATGLAPAKFS